MVVTEDLRSRIESALDSVREYLKSDGGDVEVHEIREDGVVEVNLLGNCGSCSMSSMTMKAGIEQVILKVAPEVTQVVAVNATK
ncbi:NifU family protein [Pontibacter sp. G13]|uniref:NifU family protein n=1 Tax=Pontibacter sp. G13 TaxID=3074898 RepID=UPI00288A243D|nr:NifU family protein [Pontibacter sp. G13]WNJ18044.1 NifU family protein [Pontibacter sp. G13]